jgi:hypothetical protein
MIGDWLAASGLLAVAIAVVFGPGAAVGAAMRLRGLALWATAPAITVAVLSVLAIALQRLGIPWTIPNVAVACAIIAVIAWAGAIALGPRNRPERPRGSSALVGAGLLVGAGIIAGRLMAYIGDPSAISQTNDAVFHLNALRWVLQTGSASSLDLTGVVGGTTFYPAGWHAVVSLVASIAPAEIPVAVNMVSLVIAAGIWPLGMAWFARVASGGDRIVTAIAAALSGMLLSFPQLMFEWGVLYPYALSIALVPAAAAAVIAAPGWWRGDGPVRSPRGNAAVSIILVGTSVVAISLSQPASLLAWGILVACWATGVGFGRIRQSTGARRAGTVAVVVGVWLVLAAVWSQLSRLAGPVHWEAYRSPAGAAADVLLNSHASLPPAIGMTILLVVGLIVAVRTPKWRWLLAAWAVFALLYILCAGTNVPLLRQALTGPWYADPYRLAALAPLTVIPLAAVGLSAIVAWIARAFGRRSPGAVAAWALGAIAVIGAVGILVAPVIQMRLLYENSRDLQSRYALNDKSYLSTDERLLLTRLPELVPADALLIGNPSTGVGFAFVLGQRDIVSRTWSPPVSPEWTVLAQDLRNAADDPAVCDALAVYGNPGYVLDFGPGEATPGRYVMPGMTGFEGRPGFELVAQEGEASLWEITACR